MLGNSLVNPVTNTCVNLAPGCIDHMRNSLRAVWVTLALLATPGVAVRLAVL
jgi:hypothetical protein